MHMNAPQGTQVLQQAGLHITKQCNDFVRAVLRSDADWLFIMGDDHTFHPLILTRLLARNVDVVVPNCLTRSAPFYPVQYDKENEDGLHGTCDDLPPPGTGLHEIHAAGSAGMLVRRHVLEALPEDPFNTSGALQNEDLEFCRRIREAGFKIHVDVDEILGHIGTMRVEPRWHGEKGWGARIFIGPETEDQRNAVDLYRVTEKAMAAA